MKEKETLEKTPSGSTEESENTDQQPKDGNFIPKQRFNEVNEKKKELEARLAEIETEKKAQEQKKLEEEGKLKELTDQLKKENEALKLEGLKRDKIQKAISNNQLDHSLAKLVFGNTAEEIDQSLNDAIEYQKQLLAKFKEQNIAEDNSGKGAQEKKEEPKTQQEWIEFFEKQQA